MDEKIFLQELKKCLHEKQIKQKELAVMLGVAPPTISNILSGRDRLGKKQSTEWGKVLDIDPLWLMTQGEQGVAPNEQPAIATASPIPSEDIIMVPVINLDVRGGLLPNAETDTEQFTTALMPFSRSIACEGDVVVPVFGDSMAPRYPSGSHILIRPLPMWREWLELGQSYVLELSDWRRTIKIVRKGATNDTYRLECYNVDYDTTEIPKSLIEHIWQVLMCVKREVM
jgi:transcriptional regulator with XRE-family HTH domain